MFRTNTLVFPHPEMYKSIICELHHVLLNYEIYIIQDPYWNLGRDNLHEIVKDSTKITYISSPNLRKMFGTDMLVFPRPGMYELITCELHHILLS